MDPFIGEIRAVGFSFAPQGWALCDGSIMQIGQNTGLFSVIGTQYGGNGTSTFALPDLRGRVIVNAGAGPGLTKYPLATKTGAESVALTLAQMPAHSHSFSGQFQVSTQDGNSGSPVRNFLANAPKAQYAEEAGSGTMAAGQLDGVGEAVGGNQGHENRQPHLALYYLIALTGIQPPKQG